MAKINISAEQFFETLYSDFNGQQHLEIRKLPGGAQVWCRSPQEAAAASNDPARNVYFGISLRDGKQGDEAHASLIPALWCDVDAKDFDGDWKKMVDTIKNFEFGPSIGVNSGGGFHLYWLLKKPEEVTEENRAQIRGILLGIAQTIGGDPACRDLSRILRVPETWNLKDPDNKKQVQVMAWYPERQYNLSDFEHYHVEETKSTAEPVPEGEADASRVSRKTKDFLAVGAPKNERNGRLFSASCDLKG